MTTHILKTIWRRWTLIGRKVGHAQGRLMLLIFYFAVVGPFAGVMKCVSDPLRLRTRTGPEWLRRPRPDRTLLQLARRQF